MKTIWAVACAVSVVVIICALASGCAGRKANNPVNLSTTNTEMSTTVQEGNAVAADYSGGPRYRIGPEDKLRVSVWENKELTLDVVVRPDGKISLPLIQDVQAEGLTATELAGVINQKLLGYIKDPYVSVIVLEVNASKYYMIGYVRNPGTYPLRGDISILQALSLAGGFTDFASRKKIRLVRNRMGKQEVRVINYYDLIDNDPVSNYLLRPGDTIVVP